MDTYQQVNSNKGRKEGKKIDNILENTESFIHKLINVLKEKYINCNHSYSIVSSKNTFACIHTLLRWLKIETELKQCLIEGLIQTLCSVVLIFFTLLDSIGPKKHVILFSNIYNCNQLKTNKNRNWQKKINCLYCNSLQNLENIVMNMRDHPLDLSFASCLDWEAFFTVIHALAIFHFD